MWSNAMKKKYFLLPLVVLIVLRSQTTFAQFFVGGFIEPMLTYESGTGDVNFPSPYRNSESKVEGLGLGARLGAQVYETIFAGIDGRYSFPTFKDTSLNQDVEARAWNLGPLVGIQMPTPIGLRFWASWILAGELDPDRDQGVDEIFKSGNGFRLGGGINLAIVSLNLEYQYLKYDTIEIEEVGIFNTGYTSDEIALTNKSIILSASFPIGL